jgi:peptidoglycan-associated lipoprotein
MKEKLFMQHSPMSHRPKLNRLGLAAAVAAALALGACSTTQHKVYEWELVAPPSRPVPPPPPPPPPPKEEPSSGGTAEDFAATAGERVFFDFDKSVLKPESRATLDRQIEWLNRYPDVNVSIEGNTDIIGKHRYNMGLGMRRAQAVKSYLISHGVAANRIVNITSNGPDHPIDPGRNEAAYAQNRNSTTVVIVTGLSR